MADSVNMEGFKGNLGNEGRDEEEGKEKGKWREKAEAMGRAERAFWSEMGWFSVFLVWVIGIKTRVLMGRAVSLTQ